VAFSPEKDRESIQTGNLAWKYRGSIRTPVAAFAQLGRTAAQSVFLPMWCGHGWGQHLLLADAIAPETCKGPCCAQLGKENEQGVYT